MRAERTVGGVLRTVGRVALWLAVGLVLVRGVASFVGDGEAEGSRPPAASTPAFPDAEAEAFAASFARAYFTFAPGRQEWVAVALRPYLAPGLREDGGLQVPDRGPAQIVEEATVGRTQPVDRRHALVTVATTVSSDVVTTRYLTVPVARDARGGLAVYDYPSIAPPPPRADVEAPAVEPLGRAEQAEVEALLERFFPVFLTGRTAGLDYFLPAGTHMRALPERYRFLGLRGVEQARGGRTRRRTVLAEVEAQDRRSGASFVLRYRIALVKRDRWYVAGLNAA